MLVRSKAEVTSRVCKAFCGATWRWLEWDEWLFGLHWKPRHLAHMCTPTLSETQASVFWHLRCARCACVTDVTQTLQKACIFSTRLALRFPRQCQTSMFRQLNPTLGEEHRCCSVVPERDSAAKRHSYYWGEREHAISNKMGKHPM